MPILLLKFPFFSLPERKSSPVPAGVKAADAGAGIMPYKFLKNIVCLLVFNLCIYLFPQAFAIAVKNFGLTLGLKPLPAGICFHLRGPGSYLGRRSWAVPWPGAGKEEEEDEGKGDHICVVLRGGSLGSAVLASSWLGLQGAPPPALSFSLQHL